MRRKKMTQDLKPQIPIAPLIDAVFLLLIYFMVTSSMERQESDIPFELPGTVEQDEPVDMPDQQIIEIRANGQVVVNEYKYDAPKAEDSSNSKQCLPVYGRLVTQIKPSHKSRSHPVNKRSMTGSFASWMRSPPQASIA